MLFRLLNCQTDDASDDDDFGDVEGNYANGDDNVKTMMMIRMKIEMATTTLSMTMEMMSMKFQTWCPS